MLTKSNQKIIGAWDRRASWSSQLGWSCSRLAGSVLPWLLPPWRFCCWSLCRWTVIWRLWTRGTLTTSRVYPSMAIVDGSSGPCAMTFVFFGLMVKPNSLQARERRLTSCRRPSSVYDVKAASSENSNSRMNTSVVLVLARRRAMLKILPSDMVWL